MSEPFSPNLGSFNASDIPNTPPTDKRRSRIDIFSQSPMIKISEEDATFTDDLQHSQLPNLLNNTLHGHFNPPRLPNGSLYSLDSNSSSSIHLPGGNVPGNRSSISSLKYVPPPSIPLKSKSPTRNRSPKRQSSPIRHRSQSPNKFQPFNFQSTNLNAVPSIPASRTSHRKGHRYKHSSVSMNFFQEPKARAPLKISASFPIPNYSEILSSCSSEQKVKLGWSLIHLLFALVTFLVSFKFSLHSFSTLSHLIFYDSLACLTVVFVDIMGNFDVWSKSSIKYPFGLGRIEVLFGFALSVSLIFVGCDLVSHFIEEFMFSFFDNAESQTHGHNHHDHDSSTPTIGIILYETIVFITLLITFISSNLKTSKNPKSTLSPSGISLKESIITNPTHIITFIFTSYLGLNPLILSIRSDIEINKVASLVISLLICYMGWQVVKYLGYIVLLGFPETSQKNVLEKLKDLIQESTSFKSNYKITNLIISRVHLSLVIVLIDIKMKGGSDDDETNLRQEVGEITKQTFKDMNIEITVDIDRL